MAMNIMRDIQSLSDFKQNASKYVKQVQETGEPLVLTVNGKPVAVVQDAKSYQSMVDARERATLNALLAKRLRQADSGETVRTAEEFFDDFSKNYGVSFKD